MSLQKLKNFYRSNNILLVVPNNSSFKKPIFGALERLGFTLFEFDYRRTSIPEKLSFLFSKIFPCFRPIAIASINKRLINKAIKVKATIIFVVKGELINPSTISAFNQKGMLTINWYPDYFNNDPKIINKLKPYKFVFQSDIYETSKLAKEFHGKVHHLAFAGQSNPPKKQYKKIYPITFIGSYSSEREKILSTLNEMPLYIWGDSQWAGSSLKKHFQGKWLNQAEMLKIFYKSKVIINIHQTKSKKTGGVNLRCFEVTGAQQFLLSDNRRDLPGIFDIGKELIVFKDKYDLLDKVQYYLDNEKKRQKVALAGYLRFKRDHTYDKRLRQLMEICFNKSFLKKLNKSSQN